MTKNTLLAALALVGTVATCSTASAQDKSWYAGPTLGATFNSGTSAGLNVGKQLNDYVRLEADYDHGFNPVASTTDTLAGNGILQYKISGTKLTPYALAGAGYQWQNGGVNQGVWNVGGGTRVDLTTGVDLDVRYRYVQGLTNATISSSVVTFGTTFKF